MKTIASRVWTIPLNVAVTSIFFVAVTYAGPIIVDSKTQEIRVERLSQTLSVGPDEKEVAIISNPELENKLKTVASKIISGLPPKVREQFSEWKIYIIDYGQPNAFGGSGNVAVDRRYVENLSGDELAFLVAHEVAHSTLGHHVPDIESETYVEKLVGPLIELLELRLSRGQEKAADNFALTFMERAGYNVEGALSFLQKEMKEKGKIRQTIRRVFWFLDTHPTLKTRLNAQRERLHLPPYTPIATKVAKEIILPTALDAGLHLLGIKAPVFGLAWPRTALAPGPDSSQVVNFTPQQQLTPVNTSFTQTYSGTMSQTIGVSGSRTTPFVGTFTGARSGVLPGNFTGSFVGTNTYNADCCFANPLYVDVPFNATMTGQVKGFLEGDLKGTANVTLVDQQVPSTATFTYSGNVTIKSDGSLVAPLTGTVFQSSGIPGFTPGIVGTSTISHSQAP